MAGENNFINNLDNFRSCCRKVIALTFAENMTLYENVCAVITKLNEVIDSQNMVIDQVNALTILFQELKKFVEDYFDNLDVQEEINNKLDEMAKDGTLAEIINQNIFNDLNTRLSEEIATRSRDDNALQKQIDDLVLEASGTDNEVVQARTAKNGSGFSSLKLHLDAIEDGRTIMFPWRVATIYTGTIDFQIDSQNPAQSICTITGVSMVTQDGVNIGQKEETTNLIYNHNTLAVLYFNTSTQEFVMKTDISTALRENYVIICASYQYNLYTFVDTELSVITNNGNLLGRKNITIFKRGTFWSTERTKAISIDTTNRKISWNNNVYVLTDNDILSIVNTEGEANFLGEINDPQLFVFNTLTGTFEIINFTTRYTKGMGNNHVVLFAYYAQRVYLCDENALNWISLNGNFITNKRDTWNLKHPRLGTWSGTKLEINTVNSLITLSNVAINSDNALASGGPPSSAVFTYNYNQYSWTFCVVDMTTYTIEFYNYNNLNDFAYTENKILLFTYYQTYLYFCEDHLKSNTTINGTNYWVYHGLGGGGSTTSELPEIITTRYIDCVTNKKLSMYFNNISSLYDGGKYIDINSNVLVRNEYGISYTSTEEGETNVIMTVTGDDGVVTQTKNVTIRSNNINGDGSVKRIMVIGDSLVDNQNLVPNIMGMLNADSDYLYETVGTRSAGEYTHEGRGGWGWYNYVNSDSYDGKINAFRTDGNINFEAYLSNNNLSEPDYIFILLGTNDITQGITLPEPGTINSILLLAQQFIDPMLEAWENCKVIIGLPSQGAPFIGGGNSNMRIFHEGINMLNAGYINYFDNGVYSNRVSCVNHGAFSFNPLSYPYIEEELSERITTVNTKIYTDSIHPNGLGYQQWADGIYFKIKSLLNGNI